MTTAQLLILCAAALIALAVFAWSSRQTAQTQLEQRAAAERAASQERCFHRDDRERGRAHELALREADHQHARELAATRVAEDRAPSRVSHRVTVHVEATATDVEHTLHGVLVGDYPDRLCLEHAEYVTAGGKAPLAGRQDIATSRVAWVDVFDLVESPAGTDRSGTE